MTNHFGSSWFGSKKLKLFSASVLFKMSTDFKKVIGDPSIMAQVANFLVPKCIGALEQVSKNLWCSSCVWNTTVRARLKSIIQRAIIDRAFDAESSLGILAPVYSFWAEKHIVFENDGVFVVQDLLFMLRKLGYGRWVKHLVGLWKAQVGSARLRDILEMEYQFPHISRRLSIPKEGTHFPHEHFRRLPCWTWDGVSPFSIFSFPRLAPCCDPAGF